MIKCRNCDSTKIEKYGFCTDCWNKLNSTFDKNNSELKIIYLLNCNKHGNYLSISPKSKCPNCYSIKAFCKNCSKELYFKISEKEKDIQYFCSKQCSSQFKSKPGICIKCNEFSENRNGSGICKNCLIKANNILKSSGNCTICNEFNDERDQRGRGKTNCKCSQNWYLNHNSSDKMREISSKRMMKWHESGDGLNFIKNLNKQLNEKYSKPGNCTICGEYSEIRHPTIGCCKKCLLSNANRLNEDLKNQILTGERDSWPGTNPNFITKNNIRFYKEIEINELIKQLNNNEIEMPYGFNKRFGEWYYKTENILTGEIFKLNNSYFEEKDNQLYYYDNGINDYVLWKDYKKKFYKNVDLNIDFINYIKKLYKNSFIQITYRTQDSLDWSGARQAFEQDLVDKDISWFAYIKFYIDKNETLKPLVVGKTGSLLVNKTGSDVLFSLDENDGPARKFLKEENYLWDKTQIVIIPCETEDLAYKIEKEIMENYKLFGS